MEKKILRKATWFRAFWGLGTYSLENKVILFVLFSIFTALLVVLIHCGMLPTFWLPFFHYIFCIVTLSVTVL